MTGGDGQELGAPPDGARRAGAKARSLPARRPFSPPAFQASKKIRDLLSRRIEDSSFTQRDLEQQLGFAKGYLTRMLRGRRKLEVGDLFALLDAVDLKAGHFFAQVCAGMEPLPDLSLPDSAGLAALEEMERRLRRCEEVVGRVLGSHGDG